MLVRSYSRHRRATIRAGFRSIARVRTASQRRRNDQRAAPISTPAIFALALSDAARSAQNLSGRSCFADMRGCTCVGPINTSLAISVRPRLEPQIDGSRSPISIVLEEYAGAKCTPSEFAPGSTSQRPYPRTGAALRGRAQFSQHRNIFHCMTPDLGQPSENDWAGAVRSTSVSEREPFRSPNSRNG